MNCHDAKLLMALHVGRDDADVSEWEQVRRHAAVCHDCRAHYKGLKKAMAVLEESDVESTYEVPESLWPEIESRLDNVMAVKNSNRTQPWVPFLSFSVACMLFLMVAAYQPMGPHGQGDARPTARGMGPFPAMAPQHHAPDDRDELAREADQRVEAESL